MTIIFYFIALYTAIQNGNTEIVRLLLSHSKIDVNKKIYDLVFIKNFVNGKIVINFKPALYFAIETRNMDIIKLLLSHKDIDINAPFQKGKSPLHLAVQNNDIEIVKLLLTYPNIDVNQICISKQYFDTIFFFLIKFNFNIYILMRKLYFYFLITFPI